VEQALFSGADPADALGEAAQNVDEMLSSGGSQ
jgi:hypothetical protein